MQGNTSKPGSDVDVEIKSHEYKTNKSKRMTMLSASTASPSLLTRGYLKSTFVEGLRGLLTSLRCPQASPPQPAQPFRP